MKTARFHTNDSDLLILGLYGVFLGYQLYNKTRSYRPRHPALFWHILAGLIELVLYYRTPRCGRGAVIACWVHSFTSLALVKGLPNGYPPHTRPVYQAGSLIRSALVVHAYITQTAMDYHSSIMPLHGFVYTRALIFLLGTIGPTRSFIKNVNSPFVYAQSVLGAALISVSHCRGLWPVPTYLVLVHRLGKLSLRVQEKYQSCRFESGTCSITPPVAAVAGQDMVHRVGNWFYIIRWEMRGRKMN
ncbi:hypothetical protein BP00DRAFT_483569 [Aspergillus indologenus CBS 114.80]|uniref:Uncharacterized protein n=1 Tax=Aspergillus indologenus CBS 114.80 TaxID=1450541 RepID=A0A2V5II82_9EURO|nr:hypothetical protein BP00DRAFT_483569 [Aspergillus indologenus CBS 114.80]